MKIDSQKSLDRLAMFAFALLLAVCSLAVIGFIVFAQFGVAAALIAAAAMMFVVAMIVLALNRAAGF
jgi:hypothetical protein